MPNRTEPNRTEPNQTKPNQTEPNRTKPNDDADDADDAGLELVIVDTFAWSRDNGITNQEAIATPNTASI